MSRETEPARLADRLGSRWALAETSFKLHACCRHTHPAADALHLLLRKHRLAPGDVRSVTALVHQTALDVLDRVAPPETACHAQYSMGTVLGLIAVHGRAGLQEFDQYFQAPDVVAFRDKVRMVLDLDVDRAYPARWTGKVLVEVLDGRQLRAQVDQPRGDPGHTLGRPDIVAKALRLAAYRQAATAAEMRQVIERIWGLANLPRVPVFLK
jgi:2-methylcitrate dehydratase PrpD